MNLKEDGRSLLNILCAAHGAPGNEGAVRKVIADQLSGETDVDAFGNLFYKVGQSTSGPKVMIEAHMDEVAFIVQFITADGFLRFLPLGGWWGHTLLAQRVQVRTRSGEDVLGVITSRPPHFLSADERKQVLAPTDMYIDVGAADADEVTGRFGIAIGDTIVPVSELTPMANPDRLMAKAFDNRVGVALAVHAAQLLDGEDLPNQLWVMAACQEEVGLRGAAVGVRSIEPDIAIVLEGPPADDGPGSKPEERQGAMGGGAQVRLRDRSAILHRELTEWALSVAQEEGLEIQVTVRSSGGTDAGAIHQHGQGVPSMVVGVPCRGIHSHNSMLDLNDYLSALKFITALARRFDQDALESIAVR
jgi:endoglucanase